MDTETERAIFIDSGNRLFTMIHLLYTEGKITEATKEELELHLKIMDKQLCRFTDAIKDKG